MACPIFIVAKVVNIDQYWLRPVFHLHLHPILAPVHNLGDISHLRRFKALVVLKIFITLLWAIAAVVWLDHVFFPIMLLPLHYS